MSCLCGGAVVCEIVEANNVTEEDCHAIKVLGGHLIVK